MLYDVAELVTVSVSTLKSHDFGYHAELPECLNFGPAKCKIGARTLDPMNTVTQILSAIELGDPRAGEKLLPLVYDELRALARHKMAGESPGQTLQATALVHEAYLRLVTPPKSATSQGGEKDGVQWNSRGHFFAAAAEAMRRILVERARTKRSLKAGGELRRQEMPEIAAPAALPDVDLLALNEALEKLEKQDPRKAQLVKLRFFTGFTIDEAAQALGISASTADNDWAYARCWLRLEMEGTPRDQPS
jgi:RNA polymerase sigma factor (TIGR02999 family)